jgi:hypothetical protein
MICKDSIVCWRFQWVAAGVKQVFCLSCVVQEWQECCLFFPFCLTRTVHLLNSWVLWGDNDTCVCRAAPLAYLILFHFQFLLNHVTSVSYIYNWWAAFMVIGRDTQVHNPKSYKDGSISKCWEFNCTFWSQIVSQSGSPPPHAHTMSDWLCTRLRFLAAPSLLVTRYEHQILCSLSLSHIKQFSTLCLDQKFELLLCVMLLDMISWTALTPPTRS